MHPNGVRIDEKRKAEWYWLSLLAQDDKLRTVRFSR
jgi:hypothetical protein